MSKFVHGLGHAAIALTNIVAVASGLVTSGKYVALAIAIQGLAHAILALVNHTPD